MNDLPPMSKGETEIAKILWRLKSASARQVHDALSASRSLDFTTVQTYLTRLEEKGYLDSRREGRAKIFTPKVKPARVIRDTVREFVERLFDGDAIPMMRHLIESQPLTDEQLKELRAMVDKAREQDENEKR